VKKFSAIWYLCVFLKAAAVYIAIAASLNVLTALPVDVDSATIHILGVPLVIGRAVYMVMTAVWILLTGLATSAALFAISEILRITANTEAFARATYSTSRKRPTAPNAIVSEDTVPIVPRRREQAITPPIFEIRQPTSNDLQFSPPERYRRQQLRAQGAPARRVTVFRSRRDNVVHEPRPAGHIEVVDWLDGDKDGDFKRIPFDKV
jgi:hypothetical protein